ncbi:MAG: YbaB/EbfC family nucleoid-associated protein [Methylacidiphilales bacterium]|nr:YbaB/EbfC family nucleoid-associated protein [Candidatus Methylacidiphilales bacterium]
MNIAKMMKQAQKMQADMQRMQEELAKQTFEGSAGGGVVKAVAGGDGELKSITISPEILKDGDVEMLQDLIVTAVREASDKGKQAAQSQISQLSSGLGLPGLG